MALNQGYTSTTSIGNDKSYTNLDAGPYVGIVKENRDPTRMGRIGVVIPAIHGSENVKKASLISCEYLAPFYGAKSPKAVNPTDVTDYEQTQHAYGMWMTPPDLDTKVLVTFAEGKITQAYWIGCIQEPFVNNMVPGIASSENTFDPLAGDRENTPKENLYGSQNLPAGEVNRGQFDVVKTAGYDNLKKPIHPFADRLYEQGLIQDDVRGNTSSSARREAPSNVFGISTPGPIDKRSTKKTKTGPVDDQVDRVLTRKTGHTFVMDDGDSNGENHLVRLRTSSGHQLLMHDTAGVVYLANADGTVWMEFANNGIVDVYAQTGYNLRSGADINFHAEGNINMYANKNVRIKANENSDNSNGSISLDGANIKTLATQDIRLQGSNIYAKATQDLATDAGQKNIHQGRSRVDLVGGQVHFNYYGVNSNLVETLLRSKFNEPSGTGTAFAAHPDVNLQPIGNFSKIDRSLPGMTGMRVPTHEPFWGHQNNIPAFGSVGGTNSRTGSTGWMEDRNRNSDLMSVRHAQYKADLATELSAKPQDKEKTIISLFNAGYVNKFGLSGNRDNFLQTGVDGYSALNPKTMESYNKIISSLGSSNTNQNGILYADNTNGTVTTTENKKVTGNLSAKTTSTQSVSNLLTERQNNVDGIIVGTTATADSKNISKSTETFKNIVGGKITQVVQVEKAISNKDPIGAKRGVVETVSNVVRSIGKRLGF